MDLHAKILSIKIDEKKTNQAVIKIQNTHRLSISKKYFVQLGYNEGHRDARHAAAELADQHDAKLNECMELLAQITHASHQQAISNHQESIILKLARKKSASWLKSNGYKIVKG